VKTWSSAFSWIEAVHDHDEEEPAKATTTCVVPMGM